MAQAPPKMMCGGFSSERDCTGAESTDEMKPHLAALAAGLGDVDPSTIKFLTVSTQVVAGTNSKYTGTAGADGRKFEARFFTPLPCNVKDGGAPQKELQSVTWAEFK